MLRWWNWVGTVLLDLAGAAMALLVALAIRFALERQGLPSELLRDLLLGGLLLAPVQGVIFSAFGLYRQVWAHASLPELAWVVIAVSVESLVTGVLLFGLIQTMPPAVLVVAWFLKVAWLGGVRLAQRWPRRLSRREAPTPEGLPAPTCDRQRMLIAGAGSAGALLAREFKQHAATGASLIGFLDDDLKKVGRRVASKPILGTLAQLPDIVARHGITHLVIAMPSADRGVVRRLVEIGRSLKLDLKTVPGLYELVEGKVTVSQVRDVQIEDLLGRPEVRLDLGAIGAYLTGETVLVTGAGGSIGSELCRQVARFAPRRLLLLGHGENSIYEVDRELRVTFPSLEILPVIADIQDARRIRDVFRRLRPRVVFHAAAHKHVPLMEANPQEAIKNNVFGTWNLARAASQFGADRFVLISSDKAVNPTGVMGASKRVAEYVIQAVGRGSRTLFVAVRFGNVLGSRGSVLPLFKQQIAAGGPVTITHPGMVRYFMTIPEAAQLVIQAAAMGTGGEIFLLDMGNPVQVIDLARDLIRLSGLKPETDIPIVSTGIRPGEKLYEEMLTAGEGTRATRHERIFVARGEAVPDSALRLALTHLRRAVEKGEPGTTELFHELEELARQAAESQAEEEAACSATVQSVVTH